MTSNQRGWVLPWHCLNQLQRDTLARLLELAKHAHYINVELRINGKFEHFEADWIKSLTRTADETAEEPIVEPLKDITGCDY